MNFYIVDDDPSIPMILQRILEKESSNTVVGTAAGADKTLADLMHLEVDIMLVDLLMPGTSGIELIKQVRQLKPAIRFVMISQVKDSDLRAQAYEAGIEFFIDKPINVIEVKTVVEKVGQSIQMAQKLENIQSLVGGGATAVATPNPPSTSRAQVLAILRFLGITSEAGSSDILSVSQIMQEQRISFGILTLKPNTTLMTERKKIMFQRIRRAIKTGLTNLATLCMDDMGDEIVVEYANTLYDYKNVRDEMLYLEGKRSTGGKTSLKHFFDGLVQER